MFTILGIKFQFPHIGNWELNLLIYNLLLFIKKLGLIKFINRFFNQLNVSELLKIKNIQKDKEEIWQSLKAIEFCFNKFLEVSKFQIFDKIYNYYNVDCGKTLTKLPESLKENKKIRNKSFLNVEYFEKNNNLIYLYEYNDLNKVLNKNNIKKIDLINTLSSEAGNLTNQNLLLEVLSSGYADIKKIDVFSDILNDILKYEQSILSFELIHFKDNVFELNFKYIETVNRQYHLEDLFNKSDAKKVMPIFFSIEEQYNLIQTKNSLLLVI